jgi:hypothetical protein
VALRDTDLTDDRLANVLTMLSEPADEAALDQALLADWIRVYRLPRERARLDSTMVMPRAILSRWAGAPWPMGWRNRPQPQRRTQPVSSSRGCHDMSLAARSP